MERLIILQSHMNRCRRGQSDKTLVCDVRVQRGGLYLNKGDMGGGRFLDAAVKIVLTSRAFNSPIHDMFFFCLFVSSVNELCA